MNKKSDVASGMHMPSGENLWAYPADDHLRKTRQRIMFNNNDDNSKDLDDEDNILMKEMEEEEIKKKALGLTSVPGEQARDYQFEQDHHIKDPFNSGIIDVETPVDLPPINYSDDSENNEMTNILKELVEALASRGHHEQANMIKMANTEDPPSGTFMQPFQQEPVVVFLNGEFDKSEALDRIDNILGTLKSRTRGEKSTEIYDYFMSQVNTKNDPRWMPNPKHLGVYTPEMAKRDIFGHFDGPMLHNPQTGEAYSSESKDAYFANNPERVDEIVEVLQLHRPRAFRDTPRVDVSEPVVDDSTAPIMDLDEPGVDTVITPDGIFEEPTRYALKDNEIDDGSGWIFRVESDGSYTVRGKLKEDGSLEPKGRGKSYPSGGDVAAVLDARRGVEPGNRNSQLARPGSPAPTTAPTAESTTTSTTTPTAAPTPAPTAAPKQYGEADVLSEIEAMLNMMQTGQFRWKTPFRPEKAKSKKWIRRLGGTEAAAKAVMGPTGLSEWKRLLVENDKRKSKDNAYDKAVLETIYRNLKSAFRASKAGGKVEARERRSYILEKVSRRLT